ncbi:MAG: hypothetical protein MUP55_02720 [Candidatus Aenigmarchaeota archaeon]|nr:hypothetical protein [Candidatus Aenigmarchaeota archaeon]
MPNEGRKPATALWCADKHGNIALGGLREVVLKLSRDCKVDGEYCEINYETHAEAQEVLRDLLLLEKHMNELLEKSSDKIAEYNRRKESPPEELVAAYMDFYDMLDKTREIRQELVLTNLPFRANLPVKKDVMQKIPELGNRIDKLISRIDAYSDKMDINKYLPTCERCEADFYELMKATEDGGGQRRALVTHDEVYDSEISSPRRGKRSLLDGLPRPLAKVQERLGPSEGKGKGGVTASGFPLKSRERIWQPGQLADKFGGREKAMERTDDEKLKPESKEGWYPGKYLRGRVRDREYEPESDDEERPRQRLLGGFRKRLSSRED